MIFAGTGHRPDKLGGYGDKVFNRLVDLAVAAIKHYKPTQIISGMALGWDQALAQAAIDLEIQLIAAIPFVGQESTWPQSSQQLYHTLLQGASEVVIVCDGSYASWKMQKRNEYMMDRCDKVFALFNGDKSGGTRNAVDYASKIGKPIINLWNSWVKFR